MINSLRKERGLLKFIKKNVTTIIDNYKIVRNVMYYTNILLR